MGILRLGVMCVVILTGYTDRVLGNMTVIPGLLLNERYNSNIYNSVDNEEADIITTCTPGIKLLEKTERLDVDLSTHALCYFYKTNDQENTIDQNYSGQVSYNLHQRLRVSSLVMHQIDSRIDREIDETGLIFDTSKRRLTKYSGGFKYIATEKATAQMIGSYADYKFDSDKYVDSWNAGLDASMIIDISELLESTTDRTRFGYHRYDYGQSIIDNYYLMVGFGHNISEVVTFSLDFGGRYTHYTDTSELDTGETVESKTGNQGWVGDMSVSYRQQFWTGQLNLSRNIENASGRTNATERSSINGSLNYRFSENISCGLSTSYYLNQTNNPLENVTDTEKTWQAAGSLIYTYSKDVNLKIGYAYSRTKNEADQTSTRNVIDFQIYCQIPLMES
ncbi:MAG: hypothetical protein KJ737_22660 [Proteobacteria bacterium]|nr:hypothetical protein [Pseudomonadota bacterium]